ncbi:MAG: phosphate acyltransferase PlsX [Clostridia bacterium]|nr:phosphate acyltransferase PlsX [Clostridia bacterium]
MIIALDAMGGDNAPNEIVKGAVMAVREAEGFDVLLLGDEAAIKEVLGKEGYSGSRITIKGTTEVITNDDVPTRAIKQKKDSSMVVGFELLRDKKVDSFVSAGNSGALLAGAVMILKKLPGVDRPAVASAVPTKNGHVILLDSGFNTNIKPENYVQFAYLGSAYVKAAFGAEDPRVGLVNIGVEEKKGSNDVREANELLKHTDLNYIGNLETRDFFNDLADVIVTDGFTGNVMLKLIEGASDFFFGEIKSVMGSTVLAKLGALFMMKKLKLLKTKLDSDVLGGAPLLGVDGLLIKSHGSSKARTIKYVLIKANTIAEAGLIEHLKNEMAAIDLSK